MSELRSFQDVLAAAVSDIVENGYDSVERVDRWLRELRLAAERSMVAPASMEQQLSDSLAAIYKRQIEDGHVLKHHPGIPRFNIEKIKLELRSELDRRIAASAGLIKLNREESVDKTMRRLQGWMTSVPAGGVSAEKRSEVKANVQKSLKSLPFEERRVLIDQGHKLVSAMSEILAADGGAIAGLWRSNYRQAGYDYREDHRERDDRVYLVRDSWAHRAGLVKRNKNGYYDEITAPGQEPFCFPGGSQIQFADGVDKAYRRWFDGELAAIVTSSGNALSATPNHPVLTPEGWVPIGSLKVGDEVLEASDEDFDRLEKHHDGAVPLISDVFDAIAEFGVQSTRDGELHQFHGDGAEGDVDVVDAAFALAVGAKAFAPQKRDHLWFAVPGPVKAALRALRLFGGRCLRPAAGLVRRIYEALASRFALAGHSNPAGIASPSDLPASLADKIADDLARHARLLRDSEHAGSLLMGRAKKATVVEHVRRNYRGHVYNLQTVSGWYIANGVIVHNCRCYMIWLYNVRDLPADMVTQAGRRKLVEVGMHTNATRAGARADSMDGKATQAESNYMPWWPGKVTRCQRCEMFRPGAAPSAGGCSAVEGEIAFNGHCRLFAIAGGARADSASNENAESYVVPEAAVGYEAMRRRLARLQREADEIDRRSAGRPT